MKLEERAAVARADLQSAFADHLAPPVARVRAVHRRRRTLHIAGVAIVIAVVATAVASSVRHTDKQPLVLTPSQNEQPLGDGPARTTLDVTIGDGMHFTPDRLESPTGIVRVTLTNAGGEHKLLFADPRVRFAGIGVSEPGETRSTRASFPAPGLYRFYDPLPGHRAAGEEGTVLVTSDARGVEARVELSMTTVVSGGAIDGNLVIDNSSGSPFRFGEGCRTQWTVVLTSGSDPTDVVFPQPCLSVTELPEGRTSLPFILHAVLNAGPLPPGEYEATFVAAEQTALHPPRVPVTVTAAPSR